MKSWPFLIGVIAAAAAPAGHVFGEDDHTMIHRDANGWSIITQSGGGEPKVRIDSQPGQTVITQQSGNNKAVVIQRTAPADAPMDLPDWLRDFMSRK